MKHISVKVTYNFIILIIWKPFRAVIFTTLVQCYNENEKYTQQLARYRFYRPKFEATLSSQAVALLDFCTFLSYRFPSIHHTVKF